MKLVFLLIAALSLSVVSCKKQKMLFAPNLSIDFTNARPGEHIVIFTDLVNSSVVTFDEANGLQQSATVDKTHAFSIEWDFSNGEYLTCYQSFFNNETSDTLHMVNFHNTNDNWASLDSAMIGTNYSFDYSCRTGLKVQTSFKH